MQNTTQATFKTDVEESQIPVLVDFWAEWCGPCKMLMPILEQTSAEIGDSAKIVKVNVDTERDLAVRFNIRAIPSLIIFKNGEPVKVLTGASHTKEAIKDAIFNS